MHGFASSEDARREASPCGFRSPPFEQDQSLDVFCLEDSAARLPMMMQGAMILPVVGVPSENGQ